MKYSIVGSDKPVTGAKFRLSGKSKYGNEIMMYATSDVNGKVRFDNVEYGSYKIKEVKAPEGYINVSKEYNASVSDTGFGSIDGAETLNDGTKVIRNEPYHTVEISKQSSYNGATLSGAEFRLTGTSNYGTTYDKTATSDENGLAKFTGLEAGTYIIQETKSPKDYFLDSTKHIVKVNKDDTYTIDGLEKNGSHYYRVNNKPEENGKIIVKKKWKDSDKSKRPKDPPVIHITTDVNKIPSYAVWRDNEDNWCGPFYYVDSDFRNKTQKVEYADNVTSADQVPESAVRLDKNYDDPNAKRKIWGWLDDGTMYYWTNAQTTKLTDESDMLFYGLRNVESIRPGKIDTSEMTNMNSMFSNCRNLTSIDLSNFDTSNVVYMAGMFCDCESLTSLDLSSFDMSKVRVMSEMFNECSKLTSLNVSKWNAPNVTDMSHMFWLCDSLETLDLSSWNTPNVTDMSDMFSRCRNLTSLDMPNIKIEKVTDMGGMFDECLRLKSLDMSNFDTTNVTSMVSMFYNCNSLTSLNLSNWNTSNVTNMNYMFDGCKSLTSLDVSKFNTSNVTGMACMFDNCYKLTSLDVSNFNTSKVTNMNAMFNGCSNLTSLDVSKFNTSSVTKMSTMFCNCRSLTSLDVSSFDTSNVPSMGSMFDDCSSLTSLNVSKFDTSKVTDMNYMFNGCSDLTSLDVTKFDTSKVTDMHNMLAGCSDLTSLDVPNFNTSNVTDMRYMFSDCPGLTSLDLSKWSTPNVTNMSGMFKNCSSLILLDLSNWNTSNVTSMSSMFESCSKLTNIYVSDKWNTNKVTYAVSMFLNCLSLPNGGDKTKNNYSSFTDETHANYGKDGYLTYKAAPTAKANTSNTSFASRIVSMILSRLAVPVNAADSASYVSNEEKHCKITKDGDTWTYEFSVVDDSAKYYAYEEDVEGYTSSNDASSYGVVTKDEPLTITNTANELPKEPKPASLSLSKTADGKQLVESDKPVEKYSHTSNIDDTGKATGTYSNNLNTNGDVVTIPGASKLHVKLYCSTESGCDWACVWAGSHPDYKANENYSSSKLGTTSGKIGDGSGISMSDANIIEGDIDGDSVTFGFKSDYSVAYYGYYAVVTGKDADGNAVTKKVKTLSDTDTADIPSSYSNMAYMFDVTLKNSDSSKLSGTKIFGDTIFTDGKAQVGVKAGETKTFSSLPGGTTYTITEKKYDDFLTESKNASGTLNEGSTAEAKFANHYQKPKTPDTPKEYSGFTLKKELTGYYDKDKHEKQNFTFDVSFKKLDPNTEYSLSDGKTKFTSDADGYGYVQTSLSDNGSVTFTGLPVGALYKVTEEDGDWSSAYKIKNGSSEGNISQSADSAEKGQQLSTAWETADKGEDITVDYTNTLKKYQSLVLKKVVSGEKAPDKFKFRIDFAKLYETISSDAGTIVPDDDGNANVDVYLNAGDEIVFKNIPVNAEYKITEKANVGKASYEIRMNGKPVKSGKNNEPEKDLSTAVIEKDDKGKVTCEKWDTVNEGENATVTFTNDIPKATSVTLKKQVSGTFASRSQFFRFTVSLTGADKNQNYSFDYTKGSSSHDGKENAASITTDENGRGTADIWLKHDDTVIIKNIPLSAKYSVAEDPGEYVPSITINGKKANSVSERSAAPDVIVFTSTNTAILPTGVTQHKKAIALVCTSIIALMTATWYVLKKRHKKENKAE